MNFFYLRFVYGTSCAELRMQFQSLSLEIFTIYIQIFSKDICIYLCCFLLLVFAKIEIALVRFRFSFFFLLVFRICFACRFSLEAGRDRTGRQLKLFVRFSQFVQKIYLTITTTTTTLTKQLSLSYFSIGSCFESFVVVFWFLFYLFSNCCNFLFSASSFFNLFLLFVHLTQNSSLQLQFAVCCYCVRVSAYFSQLLLLLLYLSDACICVCCCLSLSASCSVSVFCSRALHVLN